VLPSVRSLQRPLSENTLNAALRRLGYGTHEMTSHGFRSMAATRLNEMLRWHPDVIERALAHQEPNAVRRAYTSTVEYWAERVELYQVWADYLDDLKGQPFVSAAA
jgi:integrase